MALAIRKVFDTKTSDSYIKVVQVDFDSSYPTGGEPLTKASA